ncbi:MAG: HAD hydrolase-like protein [Candidatus Pacebacteria bacterium]|nr:HAD hydrolase-like protein [Candidatus Paceibacterota bacterium]
MQDKKFGVFDFDGTIADAMPVYFDVSAEIIEREYNLSGEEFYKFSIMYTGAPIEDLFENFLQSKGKSTNKVADNIKTFFDLVNAKEFPVIDGAREAIEKVHKKGFDLFISTGSQTERTKERLEKAGLLKYFSLVYGCSEIEKGPEHISDFAKFSKVGFGDFTKNSFLLGDGPGDMRLAKSCKMKAIGVAHTFDREYLIKSGADVVFDRVSEAGDMDLI